MDLPFQGNNSGGATKGSKASVEKAPYWLLEVLSGENKVKILFCTVCYNITTYAMCQGIEIEMPIHGF
jgi:hypothetical protein